MDQTSFDRITRLLGGATSRRSGVTAALGAALGLGGLTRVADAKQTGAGKNKGKPGKEGPCGNGSRQVNICTKDKDCCTGLCNTKAGKTNRDGKGRCRCVQKGKACTANRNCCNGMTCANGVCSGGSGPKPTPTCATTPDVCASGCAFTTVQAAINAATAGATIVIGQGTYVEELTINKDLVLEGCPTATIIDTGIFTDTLNAHTVRILGGTVELRNLTIDGTGDIDSQKAGGGIFSQAPLILSGSTKVTNGYRSNAAGGVTLLGSSLTMQDTASVEGCGGQSGAVGILVGQFTMTDRSKIVNCVGTNLGGGLLAMKSTIIMTGSSEISGNRSPGGGGATFAGGTMTMSGSSVIKTNTASSQEGLGGGVYMGRANLEYASLTLQDSASITGNTAPNGAGVYSDNVANIVTVTGSATITGNNTTNCVNAGGTCPV
jgi:hypothetical protein